MFKLSYNLKRDETTILIMQAGVFVQIILAMSWQASHTFDSIEEASQCALHRLLKSNLLPHPKVRMQTHNSVILK